MKWWYADGSEKRVIPCKECGVTQCALNGSDDLCPTCPIAEPKANLLIRDILAGGEEVLREAKEKKMPFMKWVKTPDGYKPVEITDEEMFAENARRRGKRAEVWLDEANGW